jgi:hypothetical protein
MSAACGGSQEATSPGQAPTGTVETEPPATDPAETEPAAPTEPPATTAPAETDGANVPLPPAVAETRDAILDAAHARDYEGMEALLDPATFSYSFGESGDPVGYWRTLEEEGHVPIFGDILPLLLSTSHAKQDGIYAWPAAYTKDPSSWTADDLEDIRRLYSDEDIESFRQAGAYLGYRLGIREDGTWLFFVAGD